MAELPPPYAPPPLRRAEDAGRLRVDVAYRHLRERLLARHFPPGALIPAEEIACAAGVSRPTVREALRRLQGDGLVDVENRLGATVRRPGPAELRELVELHRLLAAHAAALAARRHGAPEASLLRSALAGFTPAAAGWPRSALRVHHAVATAARHAAIAGELMRLRTLRQVLAPAGWEESLRLVGRERVTDGLRELSAAILARDPVRSREAADRHFGELAGACPFPAEPAATEALAFAGADYL